MLEQLSKRDKEWRKLALKICGNKQTADDLVQEMYLTILKRNPDNITTSYVFYCLKYLYVDIIRKEKPLTDVDISVVAIDDEDRSFDDEQLILLNRASKIPYHEREILREYYDKSIRGIARDIKVGRGVVYKSITEAKRKILNG